MVSIKDEFPKKNSKSSMNNVSKIHMEVSNWNTLAGSEVIHNESIVTELHKSPCTFSIVNSKESKLLKFSVSFENAICD